MYKTKVLYQSKKDAPEYEASKNKPLHSPDNTGWAGSGYYFWESHIELAHWWGRGHCKPKYIIASAEIDFSKKCFDLHDNPDHRIEIIEMWKKLKEDPRLNTKSTPLSTVINYLRKHNIFDYEAIRLCGVNSVGSGNKNRKYRSRISFTDNYNENNPERYVDLFPPVQYCLLSPQSLNLRNYKICFPESKTKNF